MTKGGEGGALFHDHALWAESHAGRAEQPRAGRYRFQRALGQSARPDHPVARLRSGACGSGHRRVDHYADGRAALFRRPRIGRHDDPQRKCLLRGWRPPRREENGMRPPRGRLVEAALRRRADADHTVSFERGKRGGCNGEGCIGGDQRADRRLVARRLAGLRVDQRISDESGSDGGVDDEGRDGADSGPSREDPGCASNSKKRPAGGRASARGAVY
jgi:hypothetical protein